MSSPRPSVYPTLVSPGYTIKSVHVCLSSWLILSRILLYRSIDERTLVYFADNPRHILEAYIESGEGIDRAGGFAIQVRFFLLPNLCLLTFFFLTKHWFVNWYRDLVEFWCERLRAIIIMLLGFLQHLFLSSWIYW